MKSAKHVWRMSLFAVNTQSDIFQQQGLEILIAKYERISKKGNLLVLMNTCIL